MSERHETFYRPLKDDLLDMLHGTPGIGAAQIDASAPRRVHFDNPVIADLATERNGNVTARLKTVISIPEAESLYGIVGVNLDGQEDKTLYGISKFPDLATQQAVWQAPITRHIATIVPERTSATCLRETSWFLGFMPVGLSGSMILTYRGEGSIDLIGLPKHEDLVLPELPSNVWCPPSEDLIHMVKPAPVEYS